MKVKEQQEYLELLTNTLQEHLRAEIPSGEFFQVKCVVKNDRLMILIQHPQGVITDTEKIFAVIEEALESLSALEKTTTDVEVFVRVVGSKLPYAKRDLTIVKEIIPEAIDGEMPRVEMPREDIPQNEVVNVDDPNRNNQESWAPPLNVDDYDVNTQESWSLPPTDKNDENEDFDPLANAPDLSYYSTIKHRYPAKYFMLGGGLLALTMFGLGAYVVTRPCVISECQPIQVATQLQKPSLPQVSNTNPIAELTKLQAEIEQAIASLQQIPLWSSRHKEVEPLITKLSTQGKEVNLLLKASQLAQQAVQKTQKPKNSLQDLQSAQQLWRQAILPLEAINRKSPFYELAHPTLSRYRQNLQTANQQLRRENQWLKKLASAKSVGIAAQKRQDKAKSLQEFQKTRSTWEVAVNALKSIPPKSLAYADAQKLLVQYKPKLANARLKATKEQMASKTYNQALNAAKQAQIHEKQNQWQASVNQWNQALRAIKQVYQDSSYYPKAKSLLGPYNSSLQRANIQLQVYNQLQKTRTDLGRTCVNAGVTICNFQINLQGIIVSITSEYEQAIAKSYEDNPDPTNTTSHLQILQQALEVISDNAGIPLVIYDAQGDQIYQHRPGI